MVPNCTISIEYITKRLSSCEGISGYRYNAKIWEHETTLFDLSNWLWPLF